ncbi:hypothetical protein M231_01215 [Tremella mesenterica]|uniref:Uncharacterized protein n=1 Tax=Tremella mesenterica TaxID=5217 RepID=A0A4V1M4T7_TREME|nr:uncharacterized protein TREMEDRAFT_65734 [Tremella mesenterica DSM 1558]EIW66140.1 hypothetical protein TREMEDRAFT_65734 [Tremella mesenterica DSM 1558]RXK41507.1 hypothetical protein M231_01215 [Tremella mesenterica]
MDLTFDQADVGSSLRHRKTDRIEGLTPVGDGHYRSIIGSDHAQVQSILRGSDHPPGQSILGSDHPQVQSILRGSDYPQGLSYLTEGTDLARGRYRGWGRVGLGIGLILVVLLSTFYSLLFSTSLDTSLHPHYPHQRFDQQNRTAYFAQKGNFVNTYFVKYTWAWTSFFVLIHILTSPIPPLTSLTVSSTIATTSLSSPPHARSPLASYATSPQVVRSPGLSEISTSIRATFTRLTRLRPWFMATIIWASFTRWFFGQSLFDRIIVLSGGECVLSIPPDLDSSKLIQSLQSHNVHLSQSPLSDPLSTLNSMMDPSSSSPVQLPQLENGFISLPQQFCSPGGHKPLSNLLSEMAHTGTMRPRWRKGHDISGHTFLLILAIILLVKELEPTWKRWTRRVSSLSRRNQLFRKTEIALIDDSQGMDFGKDVKLDGEEVVIAREVNSDESKETKRKGQKVKRSGLGGKMRSWIHSFSGIGATILVVLWFWMLIMTGIYFHNPQEKLTGLVCGLLAGGIVDLFSPSTVTDVSLYDSETSTVLIDENEARRDSVSLTDLD